MGRFPYPWLTFVIAASVLIGAISVIQGDWDQVSAMALISILAMEVHDMRTAADRRRYAR